MVSPAFTIGPDFGPTPTPGVWTGAFMHTPAPTGTLYLILHFASVSLPAHNRLEVDLGYDTDRFTAADGADFFTRPIDVRAFPGGVPIRYFTDGAPNGGAQIDRYGRGERLHGEVTPSALSNCDPFLADPTYTEPIYGPEWFCTPAAARDWEDIECVPVADFRFTVSRSVGMIVSIGYSHYSMQDVVSTCSVTLIGPDTVLCAGHCFDNSGEDVRSGSVIFDYETQCGGARVSSYAPRFFKVIKMLKWRYDVPGVYDYAVLQIKAPPGLAPIPMRHDVPAVGEAAFGLHHPNGAVKKISPKHAGFGTVASSAADRIGIDLDISGGSSGSGLFDMSGRVTGVLAQGSVACDLAYFPTALILQDIASPGAAPAATRDVMIVFDRSGSMSLPAGTGRSKIEEARDAASLFVQLIRAGTGNKIGLVSFSTAPTGPPIDSPLTTATAAHKTTLIGPAPFSTGIVGGLMPDGATTIGGGLDAARMQFPLPGANPRTILLMTDGLQNMPPMVNAVEGGLTGIDVEVIGFGTEASLDGALLSALAEAHNGLYTRAGDGLALKKYFALAFGNIFEAGALMDPEYRLPQGRPASEKIPFGVCGEETATIVAGWDRDDAELTLRVTTPSGAVVDLASTGVEASFGRTWTFARIALPHAGERDGTWHVELVRPQGHGEFPPPAPELRFFVNVIANGGPRLKLDARGRKTYYTGDTINPLVGLGYPAGGFPPGAKVTVTIARPSAGAGNILTRAKLGPPATVGADTIPARQATLMALEQSAGSPLIGYTEETHALFDDALHNRGGLEESGIFGNWLSGVLTTEGHYAFHFRATYGDGCVATRELQWSTHVGVGIDPGRTTTTVTTTGKNPDGTSRGTIAITPRDVYGNNVGPGRVGGFTVDPVTGTTVTGTVHDDGDGTYTVPVSWDPGAGPPGVVVTQPGRAPVVVREPSGAPARKGCAAHWVPWWIALIGALVAVVLAVLLLRRDDDD